MKQSKINNVILFMTLAIGVSNAHAEFPPMHVEAEIGGNSADRIGVSGQLNVRSGPNHDVRLGLNLGSYVSEDRSYSGNIPKSGFALGGVGSVSIWQNETSPIGFALDLRVSRLSLRTYDQARVARLSFQERIGMLYRIVAHSRQNVCLGFGALYTLNFFGSDYPESKGDWYSNRSLAPVLWFSTQF